LRALPRRGFRELHDARRLAHQPLQHLARGAHVDVAGVLGERLALDGGADERHRCGDVHPRNSRDTLAAGGRRVGATGERLAKPAHPREVEVLLAREPIHAADELLHARRQPRGGHHRQFRFREEREAVPVEVCCELVEVQRIVGQRQVIVEQRAVRLRGEPLEFLAQQPVGLGLRDAGFGKQRRERARRVELRARTGDAVDMVMQDLPGRFPDVATRIDVVADEEHAIAREPARREPQQRVAYRRRHPRVHAVRND
jgi:hypothetical protein